MDLFSYAIVVCMIYGAYKLYKQIYAPMNISVQPVSMLDSQITPVYTFPVSKNRDGSVNIEHVTLNIILADKPKLLEAIKYTLDQYGACTNVNSYLFYYGDVLLVKLMCDENGNFNAINRLPRSSFF